MRCWRAGGEQVLQPGEALVANDKSVYHFTGIVEPEGQEEGAPACCCDMVVAIWAGFLRSSQSLSSCASQRGDKPASIIDHFDKRERSGRCC